MFRYRIFFGLPKPVQVFLRAYVLDYKTMLFRVVPLVFLNIGFTLAAIIVLITELLSKEINWVAALIKLAIVVFIIAAIYGFTLTYWSKRDATRKHLYHMLRWDLGLQQFDDYKKDDSHYLRMQWNGLFTANRITAVTEIGKWSMHQIGSVKDLMGNLNVQQGVIGKTWIVDYPKLKHGRLDAYPVPVNSPEHTTIAMNLVILEIYKNTLGSTLDTLPDVDTQERNGALQTITLIGVPHRVDSKYDIKKAEDLLTRTFPSQYGWHINTSIAGKIIFEANQHPAPETDEWGNLIEEQTSEPEPTTNTTSAPSESTMTINETPDLSEFIQKSAVPTFPTRPATTGKLPPRPTRPQRPTL